MLSGCHWIAGYDSIKPAESSGDGGPKDMAIVDADGWTHDGAGGDGVLPPADGASDTHDPNLDAAPQDTGIIAPVWAQAFGPTEHQKATDVAVDSLGNIYVVGETTGAISFDVQHTLAAGAYSYGYLLKLAPNGDHLWHKQLAGEGDLIAKTVTVTSDDDVVVAGNFTNSATITGIELTGVGYTDIFVARYSPTGQPRWAKRFVGTDWDSVEASAPAANGAVVLVGYFGEKLDGEDLGLNYPTYAQEALVLKLDASGNSDWYAVAGGPSFDRAYAVATNAAGEIAVAGITFGGFSYGSPPNTLSNADANADLFVWTMSASGQGHDALLVEGDVNVEKIGLHLSDQRSAVICFRYTGTPIVDGVEPLGTVSDLNIGVLALDLAASSPLWAASYGGLGADTCHDLAVSSGGDVTFTGYFNKSFGAGAPTVVASGPYDGYVARLDGATQTLLWVEPIGGAGMAQGHAVAIAPDGRVVVAGELTGETKFGGLPVDSPSGDTDAFVLSFAPTP